MRPPRADQARARGLRGLIARIPLFRRLYGHGDRRRARLAKALAANREVLATRDEALAAARQAARRSEEAVAAARSEIARIYAKVWIDAFGICRTHEEHAELRAWIADLAPWEAEGGTRLRVGADRDGGYIMLEDFEGIVGAVSAGIGGDVSWDLAIAGRGIPVVQLDHTVEAPPEPHALFRFHRRKLVPDGLGRPHTATLRDILAAPPFDRGGDAILKMDIESDEWAVLDAASPADLARFRQIVLELHAIERFAEPGWRATARRVTAKLAATHRSIHVHGNNAAPFAIVAGVPLPRVFEVSWLRADGRRFVPSDRTCPGPLDRPNMPDRPDLTFVLPAP